MCSGGSSPRLGRPRIGVTPPLGRLEIESLGLLDKVGRSLEPSRARIGPGPWWGGAPTPAGRPEDKGQRLDRTEQRLPDPPPAPPAGCSAPRTHRLVDQAPRRSEQRLGSRPSLDSPPTHKEALSLGPAGDRRAGRSCATSESARIFGLLWDRAWTRNGRICRFGTLDSEREDVLTSIGPGPWVGAGLTLLVAVSRAGGRWPGGRRAGGPDDLFNLDLGMCFRVVVGREA